VQPSSLIFHLLTLLIVNLVFGIFFGIALWVVFAVAMRSPGHRRVKNPAAQASARKRVAGCGSGLVRHVACCCCFCFFPRPSNTSDFFFVLFF
jgi:hypothetical protein